MAAGGSGRPAGDRRLHFRRQSRRRAGPQGRDRGQGLQIPVTRNSTRRPRCGHAEMVVRGAIWSSMPKMRTRSRSCAFSTALSSGLRSATECPSCPEIRAYPSALMQFGTDGSRLSLRRIPASRSARRRSLGRPVGACANRSRSAGSGAGGRSGRPPRNRANAEHTRAAVDEFQKRELRRSQDAAPGWSAAFRTDMRPGVVK